MNAQDLPEPFMPADADLRGYEYMPLYGERLRTSAHNTGCTDAEFRASINLWWSAWQQVPAASLPSDERELCRLADLGRDMKAWAKVRQMAMRNFVLCRDGRFYHTFLAPHAAEAWAERVKFRARAKLGGRAKAAKQHRASSTGNPA